MARRATGQWLHAPADQFVTIERDATAIKPWLPPHQGVPHHDDEIEAGPP